MTMSALTSPPSPQPFFYDPPVMEPVKAVALVRETAVNGAQPEPWPIGQTMTVWGIGLALVACVSVLISIWVRLSPLTRAWVFQCLRWRLTPGEWFAVRSVSRSSGTPAAVLLISRAAFDLGTLAWARGAGPEGPPDRTRRDLARVCRRVFG